jgi:hypothetical protein
LAIGSDTGGSIRFPGAVTGTVGIKPTYGAVSRYGLIALASSLDQIGPVARNVLDAALLQDVISGHDPHDSTSLPESLGSMANAAQNADVKGMRIGVIKQLTGEGFQPEVSARFSESLELLKNAGAEIVSSDSLPVSEILEYMMLWSDNVLADRLAKLASKRAGNAFSEEGIAITFAQVLLDLGIDPSRMIVADGSGLSRENRVSAKTMADLLLKLRKDPQYENLYTSLPVGGVSGTLRNRFLTTAPGAVGLVHAKTGTLNGTVSLAGYIESGEREYIFVTVADKIPRGNRASDRARALMDRILGRIAAPTIAVVPAIDSTTVTS